MPTLRAAALLLNAAVFLVGFARSRYPMAPPDYVYVGFLFLAPIVSIGAILAAFRVPLRREPMPTVVAAAVLLNVFMFCFVLWLASRLDPDERRNEFLWMTILLTAPIANGLWLLATRKRGAALEPDVGG
jgi:peptidoglycan/LPS O-acetylase OafA/YrhL